MKKIILILAIVAFGLNVNAQKTVALHHNGTATSFNDVNMYQSAYNASVNGDTIYLPGGYFPGINITKRITIIGAGFHPDSTNATYQTILGGFNYTTGSKGAHIEGLYVNGSISHSGTNDSIVVRRCYIASGFSFSGTGVIVDGCVIINGFNGQNSTNAMVTNNVIAEGYQPLMNFTNSYFANNIFFKTYSHWGYSIFTNVSNSLIENNILFVAGGGIAGANTINNTFKNNVMNIGIGDLTNNWINNYPNVSETNYFVNFTWSNPLSYFVNDFHLQNPSTHLGADGTQVGIYGSALPFKEGAVPFNPHIQLKNIAPTTDVNGDLQIQIKVQAQDN